MASPPQTYFFCTKQTKSLLDALQITRNHLHFFEIKKVCQSKNAWGKYCYLWRKLYLEGMRVFSKVHFEVFSDPSGPESRPIHSFSIILVSNLTHFLNLLESSPGAQYQHFHSNHQILMFLNIECRGGGYWRNSTFCEKMKFLSKQYRLRKKKRTKNKKKFLHLTNQVKTEENWDFFAFNRICEAWEQVLIFLEK